MRNKIFYVTLVLALFSSIRCEKWFNVTSSFKSIPTNNGTKVDIDLQLEFIQLIVNALTMHVEMTYFMVLRWNDDRFLRKDSGAQSDNRHVTLYGTDTDWENIWIPDIYLVNEIPSGLLDYVPTDFIQIYENGTLKMSRRHIVTFYCKVRLFKIPMTSETCSLEFQSNSYTNAEMNLTWWMFSPVIYRSNFVSVVSKVTNTDTKQCSTQLQSSNEQKPCLLLDVGIEQRYRGFVIQVYLPSTAIVIMLWMGFWISLREVSARTRVVSVAFVAMVTHIVGIMIVFPDTVQLEPLLVWNIFCLVMNFVAFVEFIVVHNMYVKREIQKKQNRD